MHQRLSAVRFYLSDDGDPGDLLCLGVLVILADDVTDLHRCFSIEIHKFKPGILLVGKAQARGNPFLGRINETDWKLGKRLIAFGRKPSDYNPHAFQGIHAKYVELLGKDDLYWIGDTTVTLEEIQTFLGRVSPSRMAR